MTTEKVIVQKLNKNIISISNRHITNIICFDSKFIVLYDNTIKVDNFPFIKLVLYNKENVIENLIGKMVLVGYNSKYFGQPILSEHLTQGEFKQTEIPYIKSLVHRTMSDVKKILEEDNV